MSKLTRDIGAVDIPEGWTVVPYTTLSIRKGSRRERTLAEPGFRGWIFPEEGKVSAESKEALEHELAHITLGHVKLGKPFRRK